MERLTTNLGGNMTTFQIGDRVRVNDKSAYVRPPAGPGAVGTITEYQEPYFQVRMDDDPEDGDWPLYPHEIDVIEAVEYGIEYTNAQGVRKINTYDGWTRDEMETYLGAWDSEEEAVVVVRAVGPWGAA